jgi:pyruvate dehydrogenase E2 component (dihydrolipoamide acetyltransferase)
VQDEDVVLLVQSVGVPAGDRAIQLTHLCRELAVVARHTLPLSLSIDHRVVDGAEAAQFTNRVIEYLENPRLLLL